MVVPVGTTGVNGLKAKKKFLVVVVVGENQIYCMAQVQILTNPNSDLPDPHLTFT